MPTAKKQTRAALLVPKKEEAKASTATGVKIPKSLAACADRLYLLQRERYALQAKIEEMKKEEAALSDHLIDNLPKSDALGVKGKVAGATIKDREILEFAGPPEVDRFDKIYDYILRNARKNPGVWSLMQRRIGEAAAKEMIAAGKGGLIGYKIGHVKFVSLSKV